MKKLLASLNIIVSMLAFQAGITFAQNIPGTLSGEPSVTASGGSILSAPVKTATGTGQPVPTTPRNVTTGGSPAPGVGIISGQTQPVPPATDLPTVPVLTQQQTTTAQPGNLVCNQDRCQAAISQATGNQLIVMTVLLMGTLVGGLMWILAFSMSHKSFIQREIQRSNRENRMHFEKTLTTVKNKVYGAYIDSVMNVLAKLHENRPLSAQEISAFEQGSVLIKLHGSKQLCALNDHVTALMTEGKTLSTQDQTRLKSDLAKLIKADLLKSHTAHENSGILRKKSANFT